VPVGEEIVCLRSPLTAIKTTRSTLRRELLIAAAIGVLLAAGLAIVLARSAARPLRETNDAADRIARGDYTARPSVSAPDEFGELARTLNELAIKLESDMARIRQLEALRRDFVADVSHELRTPVTAIVAELVRGMGGSVDVESGPTRGTRVRMRSAAAD